MGAFRNESSIDIFLKGISLNLYSEENYINSLHVWNLEEKKRIRKTHINANSKIIGLWRRESLKEAKDIIKKVKDNPQIKRAKSG